MSKNLLCFVVVLSFVGAAFGVTFTDNGADHLWSNPENWSSNEVPNDNVTAPVDPWLNNVEMTIDGTICVLDSVQAAWSIHLGTYSGENTFQVVPTGVANLSTTGWDLNVGRGGTGDTRSRGVVFISGGEMNTNGIVIPNHFAPADADPNLAHISGKLVMQDGVINGNWLNLAENSGTGLLQLDGGVVNVDAWMEIDTEFGSIEVGGGILNVGGDRTGTADTQDMQPHINNGLITAAPNYTLDTLEYDSDLNVTILSATSDLDPIPADDSQTTEATTALTWTLPAPQGGGTVRCDVYFGTPDDKDWESLNVIDANVVTPEDDYLAAGGVDGDWVPSEIGLPLVQSDNTSGSYPVTLAADSFYSWKINVFDSSVPDPNNPVKGSLVMSHMFEFDTSNVAPVVDAGNNLYSFLDGGPRTVTLDGTLVVDDGAPVVAAPVWSVVSANTPFEDGPQTPVSAASYSFVDAGQWDAQFQMSLAGDYTLQLIGDDTDLQSAPSTMIVFLRDTACAATLIYPDFVALIGDVNLDCVVDLNDFADLASVWLDENAMDDTTEYIPE